MNRFADIDLSIKRLPPVYGYRSVNFVSIEKVLEPIESHIDQLPYYIKIAKKNCHFPSEHGLTHDESAAIYIYTMEWGDTAFDNTTLFLIEAINGKKISGYTEFENENEIILRMGSRFRVKSDPLVQKHGGYVVHLIETDENNDQISPSVPNIHVNAKWKQAGITVAGGHGSGSELNQLNSPTVEWKYNATNGQVVAGGKGAGHRTNQLDGPTDIFVNKDSLIICDAGNRRVTRWPRRNGTRGEAVLSNIACSRLTMDDQEFLYVSDNEEHDVRRYRAGETTGTVVAGGNGMGNRLYQLNWPSYICVDQHCSLYVSDNSNHRVVKWAKNAKEGIVVAGDEGYGNDLMQLSNPDGVAVDSSGTVYVADNNNHRIMRWFKDATQGDVIVGGNGEGSENNQLKNPQDLSFDRDGNLYVVDWGNHRVQRFDIEQN
ncbi:unnamed protein product [Rotaria sp. Silwood1]|nr:unnamed protein product [Rotaria sp. Silwood1]